LPSAPLAARSPRQSRTNTLDYVGGPVSCQDSYDDPPKSLKRFQTPDIPGVLPAIGTMLFAVVLNRYFDVFPPHVEVGDWITEFVAHRDLCLRSRQACLD
jgi:hypothetical protein